MKNLDSLMREILEFTLSVLLLGGAFGIAIAGGYKAFSDPATLKTTIIQSLIVVLFAFVFHEMAHRILARKYGFRASYHMWLPGLFLAIAAGLIGFLLAAPGAVQIEYSGTALENESKLGKISLAGPVVNMILVVVFYGLALGLVYFIRQTTMDDATFTRWLPTLDMLWGVFIIGIEINGWLAVFNLLPIGPFDGQKVFQWSKIVWIIAFAFSLGLYILLNWAQTRLA